MRSIIFLTIVTILVSMAQISDAASNYTMFLKAHPQAIVADGQSETTISAEVRDSSGKSVSDGTEVNFTTNIGDIEQNAQTMAGVARVRLRSANNVGTAIVSAVVTKGNAVGQIRIDFLEPGTEISNESFIIISSKTHLGYNVGGKVIDSAGGVNITSRGLSIDAQEAQIDVSKNILRARADIGSSNIVLKRGNRKVEASALYYNLTSMNGVIITPADDGAKRMLFRGRDLYTQPDNEPDKKATFDFTPVSDCTMFIKAKSMVIRPGEEIKIKRANFYLAGDKTLSMPLYVVSLKGNSGGANQMLGYGTEGLRLDVPFYYSLTPYTTGALRLKRSDDSGWGYSTQPGWQLDMEQDYNFNDSTDGSLALNRITSNDWGARWTQNKELSEDSQLYSYLDFPLHSNLYSSLNYSKSLKNYSMSMNFRGNKLRGRDGTYRTDTYIRSHSKPLLGGALNYSLSSKLSYDSTSSSPLGSGLGLQFFGKPIQTGKGSISTSLNLGHTWGGYYDGSSANANACYSTPLSNIGSLGLDYNYAWNNSVNGSCDQRLSMNLDLTPPGRWSANLYTTRGFMDDSLSSYLRINYRFLPTWRLNLLGTYQRYDTYRYLDEEAALSKAIGNQEISIIWSKSYGRFRVEFNALKF